MRIAQLRQYDTANGPGIRVTLFVSGCTHNCKGCFNTNYQGFDYGQEMDVRLACTIDEYIQSPRVKGLSILGGEPFDQLHDRDLYHLVSFTKTHRPDKTIWIWSGYTWEQLIQDERRLEILKYCDVLVDGPFVLAQRDLRLKWRGSANQRIIDVQKSLEKGEVVLYAND